MAGFALAGSWVAASEPAGGEFGKDVQLAPFVVRGKPLAISIHARTKSDRRYGEKFAEEVVGIAYETLEGNTGRGLVIVGASGEPHPLHFFRRFLEMSRVGELRPRFAEAAGEIDGYLRQRQAKFRMDDKESERIGITFDTFLPALPVPLTGVAAGFYQLAWAEGFDDARIGARLKTLALADLQGDAFARYDWVFYVPSHAATGPVLKEVLNKGMKAEKMGVLKRAAIRSALLAFRPVVNKAVEGMRKGFLFASILHARSGWSEDDIDALTRAYVREIMPDLKPGSGDERKRALAAIEKQKVDNAEYAKDPFVRPERLAAFDPVAFAPFEGEYTDRLPETTHRFVREGDLFMWNYRDHKPRPFHPAGERLLVSEDGTMTIRFLVDDTGGVTGVEERWVRRRKTVERRS